MSQEIGRCLSPRHAELSARLLEFLKKHMFTNRFTLHPRKLDLLSAEEAESCLAFFRNPEEARAERRGRVLARMGVGDRSIANLGAELRLFCREALAAAEPGLLAAAIEGVDRYTAGLLVGYMAAREEETLTEQEELRRALSRALQTQREELLVKNHAVDTSINGIMLADLGGRVTYVNSSFLGLWGYESAAEVVGVQMTDFWSGGEVQSVLASLSRTDGWHGELAARRKNGSTFTVSLATSLVKNGVGSPIGIMASFIDITESKRLEAQIQQIQKIDALGQIAGGIVHDFNNLLMAVSGYLQLLLMDAEPGTQLQHDLLQIRAAVDRGAGFTKQLRYFTRPATGKRQPTNVNEVVAETYELLKHTFPLEISFGLELAATPWTVEADPTQMSQVLVNLCVNARDAIMERKALMREEPVKGRLSIVTENVLLGEGMARRFVNGMPGRYVRLCVSDTGIGMPEELVNRLFIPFVTTKASKTGAGLGLAVVYGIVQRHRGFIDVTSTIGEGTTFSVYLPVVETPGESTGGDSRRPNTGAAAQGTVLVVDDDEQVREVIVRALGQSGYTVLAAPNGMDALALFEERRREVDLVVLDMVMPTMGGAETLQRLKQLSPHVAVLVVTGYTTEDLARELAASGADGLVEKPLDLGIFVTKVKELVGGPFVRPR